MRITVKATLNWKGKMKEKRKSSFAGYFVRQRRILYHVLSFYFFLAVEVALVVADLAVG